MVTLESCFLFLEKSIAAEAAMRRLSKKVSQNILKDQMRRRVRRICIFPKRKWRKNTTFSQEIARKIVRFLDFRSLLPPQ